MIQSLYGIVALLALCACIPSRAQITLSSLTANNTSACPGAGPLPAHCRQPFAGQRDTRPLVATPLFDPPPGNVSGEDPHAYLSHGDKTRIFATVMLGFCTEGVGDACHNNVRIGYNSDDAQTIAAQIEDLKRRHIDGAILVWEGAGTTEDHATQLFQDYVHQHGCKGPQQCDPMYLAMYDGPSTAYTVASTGIPGTTGQGCNGRSGADYENCVIAHIRNDMCFLNGRNFGNDAYQKSGGRPIVLVFPQEGIIPPNGPAPSWTDVWIHIDEWDHELPHNCAKPPYNANNGVPLLVFEDSAGFTHGGSSGAYYWIKPAGTDPVRAQSVFNLSSPSTGETLDQFLRTARSNPSKQAWSAAFKGFNSSRSAWGTDRLMDQACGQVWISSLTAANAFDTADPLPFLQLITWNDYNEGTEIETGIDNCYTITAQVKDRTLTWHLQSSSSFASLSTVSHVEIYDSSDGEHLTLLGQSPAAASGTWDLDHLSPGTHKLYARMVGKNSILNRISPAVPFSR